MIEFNNNFVFNLIYGFKNQFNDLKVQLKSFVETKLSSGNQKLLVNNQEKTSNENNDKRSSLTTANLQEKTQLASEFIYLYFS